jgi:histone-lysine N-methyltransferase SETMAR
LTEFVAPGTTIKSDVYCETLNNLRRSIRKKRRRILTKCVVFLHDNARLHTAARTSALIKLFSWEIFDHPSYSPDLAPSDCNFFTKVKVWLATQHFHSNEELMDGVNNWLGNLAAPTIDESLQKLVSRYDKCLHVGGNCVEK